MNNVGSYGNYWSSTPNEDYGGSACSMIFDSGNVNVYNVFRDFGYSVRLVR